MNYVLSIITIVSIFIQISPIKINPLSSLLKWIGKMLTGDLYLQIEKINIKIDKLEKTNDMRQLSSDKERITNYSYVLLHQNKLTTDQYNRAFECINRYKFFKTKYGDKINGHMDACIEMIQEHFKNGDILTKEKS